MVARSAATAPGTVAASAARDAVSRVSATSSASAGTGVRVGTSGTAGASSSSRMPQPAVDQGRADQPRNDGPPGHAGAGSLRHARIIARVRGRSDLS